LDLLIFGRHQIKVARPDGRRLEVPHIDAQARLFVLAPLADLAPWLVPPGWGESVETARRRVAAGEVENAVQVVGKL
jgi:7,8-dihydro-6-hydroxymethylpterin-pyrophosphokinase